MRSVQISATDQAVAKRHRKRMGCAVWRNPENALVPGIAKTALVVILRNGLNPVTARAARKPNIHDQS